MKRYVSKTPLLAFTTNLASAPLFTLKISGKPTLARVNQEMMAYQKRLETFEVHQHRELEKESNAVAKKEVVISGYKVRMAALLRMASPKNHTQPGSHSVSSTIDVPQHLTSYELPKLLKHCLSSSILAMTVPVTP